VRLLIDAGHEDEGISLNSDYETPLMLACAAGHVDVGALLIQAFPRCIAWVDCRGMDALMLASRNGTLPLLPLLLNASPPASTTAHDKDGNTALHYASASGELKALRLLLQYGASPLAQNAYSWNPIAYSATTLAETYFKQLVVEFEKRRIEAAKEAQEREMMRAAGMRVVTGGSGVGLGGGGVERELPGLPKGEHQFRSRVESFGTMHDVGRMDVDWSPVGYERNAMTPTEGKAGWIEREMARRTTSGE